ncbi:AbrB/MazE/SpoVT family DNA-binding domain-containing protein [Paenibacillus thailandensis]|uniref:AbrB/MazE/SpoVT family DNA-binding domain-containing protein n=1 Tax=Paenibacillus thailandensis TaxID=393250 RepID=A0ABW5R230_9BACL
MMKSTGIVRKVDSLGRVVVPKELRHSLGIEENDPLEIFVNGDQIMLRKYSPGCFICGSVEIKKTLAGKHVCGGCINKLKS